MDDQRSQHPIHTHPAGADDALARCRLLMQAHKWEAALREAQQALAQEPDEGDAHLLAGMCYYHLEQYPQAMFEGKETIRLAPQNDEGFCLLAKICLRQENFQQGQRIIDEALALAPQSAHYLAIRACLLFNTGRPQQALTVAEQALTIDPDEQTAHHVRTLAFGKLGRNKESANSAINLLQQDPESAYSWYTRGIQMRTVHQYTEAKFAFIQALQIDPELPGPKEELLSLLGANKPGFVLWWLLMLNQIPGSVRFFFFGITYLLACACKILFDQFPNASLLITITVYLICLFWICLLISFILLRGEVKHQQLINRHNIAVELAYERLFQETIRAMQHHQEGTVLLKQGDNDGARHALLGALREMPDDMAMQNDLLRALRRHCPSQAGYWQTVFTLMRIPSWKLFFYLLFIWFFSSPFLMSAYSQMMHAVPPFPYGPATATPALLVWIYPLLARLALRKGWVR